MPERVHVWSLRDPVTDRLITPDTKPPKRRAAPALKVWASPGQYEAASFVLHSARGVLGIRVKAGVG